MGRMGRIGVLMSFARSEWEKATNRVDGPSLRIDSPGSMMVFGDPHAGYAVHSHYPRGVALFHGIITDDDVGRPTLTLAG